MGWGPVDWVERVLPEAKLKNTTTLLFEIFRFERPIQRYLLKTVLPCKALGFSFGLITAVDIMAPENYMLQCQEKFYVLMPWHNKFPNSGICRAYAICICTHCCYLMVVLRDLFFSTHRLSSPHAGSQRL